MGVRRDVMRAAVAFRAVQKQHKERSDIRYPTRGKQLERYKRLSHGNGSSQGQHLALTVLIVPNLIDSGQGRWGLVAKEKQGLHDSEIRLHRRVEQRRWNNFRPFHDFFLQAKARIWP